MNNDEYFDKTMDQLDAYIDGDDSKVIIDTLPLTDPPKFTPEQIKAIRHSAAVTQRVLAHMLAVSPRTVESWETGRSEPSGSARRLLQIVAQDPKIINKV